MRHVRRRALGAPTIRDESSRMIEGAIKTKSLALLSDDELIDAAANRRDAAERDAAARRAGRRRGAARRRSIDGKSSRACTTRSCTGKSRPTTTPICGARTRSDFVASRSRRFFAELPGCSRDVRKCATALHAVMLRLGSGGRGGADRAVDVGRFAHGPPRVPRCAREMPRRGADADSPAR